MGDQHWLRQRHTLEQLGERMCEAPSNNLLLRAVIDKVHAPDCRGDFKVGGCAPHAGRAAAEQGRWATVKGFL